jgi:hypothetical protein
VGIKDTWKKGATKSVDNFIFSLSKRKYASSLTVGYFYTEVMRSEVKRAEFIIGRITYKIPTGNWCA